MKKRLHQILWKFFIISIISFFIISKINKVYSAASAGNNTPWQTSNVTHNFTGQRITQSFWNQNPNEVAIIQALFGYTYENDGEIIDIPSIYTKLWTWYNNNRGHDFKRCNLGWWESSSNNNYAHRWSYWYENIITVTWHYINFDTLKMNGWDSFWSDDWAIIVLDTDYVIITGSLYKQHPSYEEMRFPCLAIISKRPGGTTILTNNAIFFPGSKGNIILDNVHIDWWYSTPGNKKNTASSMVFNSAASTWTHLWGEFKNVTINNSTISNLNWNIFRVQDQSNVIFGWILINNVTTYNNTVNYGSSLFEINDNPEYDVVFNNLKSFDNLTQNQYNIKAQYGGISINNSYFNPWQNQNNIYISANTNNSKTTIINNTVWNIYTYITQNDKCFLHDIIWTITWTLYNKCIYYWYLKHFDSEWILSYKSNYAINENWVYWQVGQNKENIGCLTWNHVINPSTGTYSNSKYAWNNSSITNTSGCVTRSNWNTNTHFTNSTLKYSYWKDIPMQQTVVKRSENNIVKLDIPYSSTQYIASNLSKTVPTLTTPESNNTILSWNEQIKVQKISGTPTLFSVFWPYISNALIGQGIGIWKNISITPRQPYWNRTLIMQLYSNNWYYATHFSQTITFTWQNPTPPASTWGCTFSVNNLTIAECTSRNGWTPMSMTYTSSWHETPFRLLNFWNGSWVNYRDTAINYTAPNMAQTFTYTWQCRYKRNNSQWYQVWSQLPVHIYVTDSPITANNFTVSSVWCSKTVNWKTLSYANEWNCWNSYLSAEVYLNWNFWSCTLNWNEITYYPNEWQTNTDSCIIRISDNEWNTKDVTITRQWANCSTSWSIIINTWAEYTNNKILHIRLIYEWSAQLKYKQISCNGTTRYNPTWTTVGSNEYTTTINLDYRQWWCNTDIWIKTIYWLMNNSIQVQDDILYDNLPPNVSVNARYWQINIYESDEVESNLSWLQQIRYKRQQGWTACPNTSSSYSILSPTYLDWAHSISTQVSTSDKEWLWRLCVFSWFYDRAGNASLLTSNLYNFPSWWGGWWGRIWWTITINDGADFTNNSTLNLKLSATWSNTIQKMKFSCDNTNWTSEINYSQSHNFSLNSNASAWCSTDNWLKTIYVQYKDSNGNRWWNANDSITLDTTKPTVAISLSNTIWWTVTISDTISWLSGWQSILYRWQTNTTCSTTASQYTQQTLAYTEWATQVNNIIIAPPTSSWTYYLCIYQWIYDRAGNASDTTRSSNTINISTNSNWNSGRILINNWAIATNNSNLNLTLYARYNNQTSNIRMKFSCNWSLWTRNTNYNTSYSFNLDNNTSYWCNTTEGTKTVYVQFTRNGYTLTKSDSIIYDVTKPTVSASQWNNSVTVTVSDNLAGITGSQSLKYLWTTSSSCPNNWYTSTSLWNTAWAQRVTKSLNSPWNGNYYLCIDEWISDRAWNQSNRTNLWEFCFWNNCDESPTSYEINWSITINNGNDFTNDLSLNLSIYATWTNTIGKMILSCDGSSWSSQIWYNTNYTLDLSNNSSIWCNTTNWKKTIYVQFIDSNGNSWWFAGDDIILDRTQPTVTINTLSADFWWNISIKDTISWLSGWQNLLYKRHNSTACPTNSNSYTPKNLTNSAGNLSTNITITPPTSVGTYYLCLYQWIYDRAGNISDSTVSTESITISNSSIQWSITINSWAEATNNRNLNLWLQATNASYMQFSCDQATWSSQIAYKTWYTLSLWWLNWCTNTEWEKTVYVKYIKGSNYIIRSDSIIYDTTPPSFSTTKNSDSVLLTISDYLAWLSWWQNIKYKRNDSASCPTSNYSSQNLTYTHWDTTITTQINKPWDWSYYLCILSGLYDRAQNISNTQNIWYFCFWDECDNPWSGNNSTWCRWVIQPTPNLVWTNTTIEWHASFACNVWIKKVKSIISNTRTSSNAAINDVLSSNSITNTGLDCENFREFLDFDYEFWEIGGCESFAENWIQTISLVYKLHSSAIRNIPYTDSSHYISIVPSWWAENYISKKVDSDPIRFDFEWPNSKILDYGYNTNGLNNFGVEIKISDNDNRDIDGNISTCYYMIDYWNWNNQEWIRTCNEALQINANRSFNIKIRAIDDLWNIWNGDTKLIILWWYGEIQPTFIYTWMHIELDNVEYYKWTIKLRANHNNIGIDSCEYTIDGWNSRKSANLFDWYCESPSISPNNNFTWNFRIKFENNTYATGTSLYAILDDTPPTFEEAPNRCTWENWCNTDQYISFWFYDTWIWLEEYWEHYCIINEEWRGVSCTLTWTKVCDLLKNCFADDLTSQQINIDKTPPVGSFLNATLGCSTINPDDTWLIITWYDTLSWLPIDYINIGSWWTNENIIPIDMWENIRLRDNVNNYSFMWTQIDNVAPRVQNIRTFTWYECSPINIYVDAIDTGCAGWDKLKASFDSWQFITWKHIQYSDNLRFEYNLTSQIVTWKNVSFIVKDDLWQRSTWDINIQWINVPVTWKNSIITYVSFLYTDHIESRIKRKDAFEIHAWACETVSATVISCDNGGIAHISWEYLNYDNYAWILHNWWNDHCRIRIYDDDDENGIIVTATYQICTKDCKPEVKATIVWWEKFIDRCYQAWKYTHTSWTFLYDIPTCANLPSMRHSTKSSSKYTSWSTISINLTATWSLAPKSYRISCIEDDTYCTSVSTWWNDIWCDNIYSWYFENVRWCTRSNSRSIWPCKYSATWSDLDNSYLNGTRCRRACQNSPTEEYFTNILWCVRSNNPNDGPCLSNSYREQIWSFLFWDPWGTCRRWCSLNLVKPTAIQNRVNECHTQRDILTQNSGWNVCNNMAIAWSDWITYDDFITFDLENWPWCAKNWEIVPWWSKFQSERTVWVQIKDLNWNISDKAKTDVVVYDLWNYNGKKNYSWTHSPVLNEYSILGWSDHFEITVEAEDTWLVYDIVWRKWESNATEKLVKEFYEQFIQSYSPFNIWKSENSEWFRKWTCTRYSTLTDIFSSPINNNCSCVWNYCNKDYTNYSWLTHDLPFLHTWCSWLAWQDIAEVSQETVNSNPNYICEWELTGIECTYSENRIKSQRYTNLSDCETACSSSTLWCFSDLNTASSTNTCTNKSRDWNYYDSAIVCLSALFWADCYSINFNWQRKFIIMYNAKWYYFYSHPLTKGRCDTMWYENCKLYSCNEYDSRNQYECTYRDCTDFWARCIKYNDQIIITWAYIPDSNCHCIETEEQATPDPFNEDWIIDETIFRCDKATWDDVILDPNLYGDQYKCYRCTQYSCTIRQWCSQRNTWINNFYLQYSINIDPAHLKSKRYETIYSWYIANQNFVELQLQINNTSKIITWGSINIKTNNSKNRPANETINITVDWLDDVICDRGTGFYKVTIKTWLITDFAYNPTNSLIIDWIIYNPTHINYCCDCDLNDTWAVCYSYCCKQQNPQNTNQCDNDNLDCLCASNPYNHACLCRNNPNSHECICEWNDSCKYNNEECNNPIKYYCEDDERDNEKGKLCTCSPQYFSWTNDYISGKNLFQNMYPNTTTGEFCTIPQNNTCTNTTTPEEKYDWCRSINNNNENYSCTQNTDEYCCCQLLTSNPASCCTKPIVTTNYLYVNENYFIQSWYIPNEEEYTNSSNFIQPYPVTIYTLETINNNYQIECVADENTCPWFSCQQSLSWINTNANTSYPRNFAHTLMVTKLDIQWYDNGYPNRDTWTGCIIKFIPPNGISTDDAEKKVSFTILTWMSAFLAWFTWQEGFYSNSLKQAIYDYSWDKSFLFYISHPQWITYGKNPATQRSWVLWNILYDINFSSWVADEFYYITWTAIIDWYKKELQIKKPTYNYWNPYSYLFDFPIYDTY